MTGSTSASVIGSDDRNVVPPASASHWRRICSLEIDTGRGPFRGTGWFAGPRTIVTAGHCVYRRQAFGGWARQIRVFPGRTQQQSPYGPYLSTRFSCADGWLAGERVDADVGAIYLDALVDPAIGSYAYSVADPRTLTDADVVISGYPEFGDRFDNLLSALGRVRAVFTRRLFYDTDTSVGQSGAPVWLASDTPSEPVVIAIHTSDEEATPSGLPESNSGTLITQTVADLIRDWVS